MSTIDNREPLPIPNKEVALILFKSLCDWLQGYDRRHGYSQDKYTRVYHAIDQGITLLSTDLSLEDVLDDAYACSRINKQDYNNLIKFLKP